MRAHVIQHVPFEGPAAIAEWLAERGHELTTSLAPRDEYPPAEDVNLVFVMGGPMSADDEVASPWLHAEKHFIASVIAAGRPVLGVCLGAQILAEVIGGTVRRNADPEIGWFPVERTREGAEEPFFSAWDEPVLVGHWHGDTFDLPLGIEPAFSSKACRNQAFVFDGRVVGLQFHLEWTEPALQCLIAECGDELAAGGAFVMTAEQIAEDALREIPACRARLFALLDALADVGIGEAGDGGGLD
jgi:GMP synthase-like glutamine amidotransferase